MLCQVINEEKFGRGRRFFIADMLPLSKRTEGIDFKQLLTKRFIGACTIAALLRLKDYSFVNEARQYVEQFPDNWSDDVYKRQMTYYLKKINKPKLL
jgi:hypothetical protein